MRHTIVGLAGWLTIVFVLVASSTFAAGLSNADVDRLVKETARLQEQGRLAEALEALASGIGNCGTGDDGRSCRVALRVRAGYLAERQSRHEKEPEPLHRRAAAFYEEVLREEPAHGPALNNLALIYRDLGESARGVTLLQSALSANVDMTSTLAVTLGDLLRDEKKAGEALDAYRRALSEAPDDTVAAHRIVDLYRDVIPDRIVELVRLLTDWGKHSTLDEVVEHGHRVVIDATYALAESLALQSLAAWVELSARRRWISVGSLSALPPGWKHPAVTDLASYLAAPERPPSGTWWMGATRTRNPLAGVALALGQERLEKGDAQGARARWEAGVAIAPDYEQYLFTSELKGIWIVRADLQSELASLYFKYPDLDPQRLQFSSLVQDLFGGKAEAYHLGDREAIQRYHTVLGLLFAQRHQWTSSPSFMSAIFQLDNAIKTADARAQERGPQPLPELKALLAQGYAETNRPVEAQKTYMHASEAYLDTDDVAKGREMLDRAKGFSGAPLPEGPALDTIIKSRSLIPQTPVASLVWETGVWKSRDHAWLFGSNLAGISAEFLARQRFKALADLSARAKELGEMRSATRYAAEAMRRGVKEVTSLIGFGDLVRVKHIRNAVTDPVRLEQTGGKTVGKSWLLSVPGEAAARQVAVSPEVVLAGRVIETLDADQKLLTGDVTVTIRGRSVQIEAFDVGSARDAETKLGRLEGVSIVNVRPH